ncbi:MAG TPA: APC family permease [Acidimicrobiales bacterium]|nr:APC family permease [Acidimicrobiales bacterium]
MGLTAVSLGSVIGSGWLLGALTAASFAGAASLISWGLAAFMLIFIALMYAELGSTYPVSGGTARYSFLCFGPVGGFAAGWMSWLQAVTLAPIETEAALRYLEPKWPGVIDRHTLLLSGKGLGFAILFVVFFTIVNLAGIRWMSGLNRVAVYWKAAIPVVTIAALAVTTFHPGNFTAGGGFFVMGAQGIFKALPGGVVFALLGFEQAAQLGGEARDPQRDLPRAIIASMLLGMLLYLCLEVVLIGAINPSHLTGASSWANPLGKNGSYGPYAQLAATLGLGWLATLLYIDAVVSPAGTGMLYIGTTSRITYSMGRAGTLPKVFDRVDRRGIPWFSVFVASAFGILVFLPFGGWSKLVGFISSATAFMYAFAPVSLAALRRSDPDRFRPYRVPGAQVLAPLAFVFANLIVYWGGWPTVWRICVGIAIGVFLLALSRITTPRANKARMDVKAALWVVPWLGGILALDAIGPAYVSSVRRVIPMWWDLGAVAAWSLAIFYLAQWLSLPEARVAANLASAQVATSEEQIETGEGG